MGTAHLILAAAARQRQLESQRRAREAERRRRESAERRRKQLEEERKAKTTAKSKSSSSSSSYSYDTRRSYSFEEHLIGIIENNPEYLSYVESLYQEGENLDAKDKSTIARELDEVAPQIIAEEKKLAEIRKKLEEAGVTVGEGFIIEGVRIDQPGQLAFTHRVGSHKYNFINFPIQFNGIRVNKDDIETDGSAYEQAYAKERNENPDVEEQIEKDRRRLKRQQRLANLPFFNTEERDKLIRELDLKIGREEFAIKRITESKQKLDVFRSFTPEQKALIAEYINQIYKVKELSDPAGDRVKTYGNIGLTYRSTDMMRAKWQRANDSLIKSGRVSEETVSKFYEMLTNELDRVYVGYDDGVSISEVKHISLGSEGPLSWIIRTKGMEYLKEKRDKLLEERKKLDETIELTEKRDETIGKNSQGDSREEDGGRG